MSKQTNRIIYIEPNSLPGEFAKKEEGVSSDNITWSPEDLNISVDLQVFIPSREYRPYNESDFDKIGPNLQSILSGVQLRKGDENSYFLTDDYTNISYQEIKNNHAGSKEMLGINSIHIVFDSHMYPRVTMNFTDVRGSALMMPQELYYYDSNLEKATGIKAEENIVCKNFFQAFFKFPYPRFYLSVKGIYGTCVTFVLSVEDFKATFNSETGNFDVVVTFIGLMYGLYTDIPMNYLLIAPYIGGIDGKVNAYWREQTMGDGAFFYREDGEKGNPISTFFEFRNNYKYFISTEQSGKDFVFGPNIIDIARLEEESILLDKLNTHFSNIGRHESLPEGTEVYEYVFSGSKVHALFILSELSEASISFKSKFVEDFTKALETHTQKYEPIIVSSDDLPGKLSHNTESVSVYTYEDFLSPVVSINEEGDEKQKYDLNENVKKSLTDNGVTDNDINTLVKNLNCDDLLSRLQSCKYAVYFNENFKNKVDERKKDIETQINDLEKGASEEMKALFKDSCNFTPTIENVMRMIFAHLDTFLHEFYQVLNTIKGDRTLSDKWPIDCTDIESSSSEKALMPPFTGFFTNKENSSEKEAIYPGSVPELSSLEEVNFVNEIFNGLNGKLREEAENAKNGTKPASLAEETSSNLEFTPIAVTDYFYGSTNPYSKLENTEDIWYFAMSRLYVGFRDFNKSNKERKKWDEIIDAEFNNLKASGVWRKALKQENFITGEGNIKGLILSDSRNQHIFDIDFNKNYEIWKSQQTNCEFYKFEGVKDLRDITDHNHTREWLIPRFKVVESNSTDVTKIANFRNKIVQNAKTKSDSTIVNEYCLSERVDNPDKIFIDKAGSSIFQLLSNKGEPIRYNSGSTLTANNQIGGTQTGSAWFEKTPNGKNVLRQGRTTLQQYGSEKYSLNGIFSKKNTFSNKLLWVPFVLNKNKNIFLDDSSFFFKDSNAVSNEELALWLIRCIIETEEEPIDFDYEHDNIFHFQKLVCYLIGGYLWHIEKNSGSTHTEICKELNSKLMGVKPEDIVPKFLSDVDKNNLKSEFLNFATNTFNSILIEIKSEKEAKKEEKSVENEIYTQNIDGTLKWYTIAGYQASSPQNRALQDLLIDLIKEDCWVLSFPNDGETNTKSKLFDISSVYWSKFVNKVKEEIEKNKNSEAEETNDGTKNTSISHVTKDEKLSLYLTLKNLYDRWLSTFNENSFKLKTVEKELAARESRLKAESLYNGEYSEFDNFLYVDSFYNDISNKFFVNPTSFFNTVNGQIAGDTNYSILEFIGRICEKNKLLFKCLPVYNNLYSLSTFTDIFKPLSLYSGSDRLHRRIGNTYLIMYTYEPSSKLNLVQDKANGVSYSNDSFDFCDTYGDITPAAASLYKEKEGEINVCAFGVTPGMQNQSYFTKVSVGMDNPRVTDYSIKNKFMIAENAHGGRAEGVGTGQDLFSIYSNRSYDCNVEMLGCANIMPMMYFQLNNVPMFKGAYMITKVEHNIQNNNMTTKFTGTRMSKYYIPFNTEVFNLEELSNIINGLVNEGTDNFYVGDGELVPVPTVSPTEDFNVWAAINQMEQFFYGNSIRRPYEDGINIGKCGRCATAVETFLMAGFNGLFITTEDTAEELDKIRKKGINGKSYNGYNGYNMKYQLAKLGFNCVAQGKEEINNTEIKAGDVCVIMDPDGPEKGGEHVGHVCMYTGDFWVSDYKQANGKSGYPTSRPLSKNKTGTLLYRYTGTITKDVMVYGYFENGEFKLCPDPKNPSQEVLQKIKTKIDVK